MITTDTSYQNAQSIMIKILRLIVLKQMNILCMTFNDHVASIFMLCFILLFSLESTRTQLTARRSRTSCATTPLPPLTT